MSQFGFPRMMANTIPEHNHDDSTSGGSLLDPTSIGSGNALAELIGNGLTLQSGITGIAQLVPESILLSPLDANTINANKNNWDVDGGANWPLLTPRWDVRVQAGTWNVTGIVAPASITNPLILFTTVGMGGTLSVGNLILKHNSGSSTAANRFYTPNGEDLFIPPFGGWIMNYNTTVDRWIILATTVPPKLNVGGWTVVTKTANEDITNSAAMQNDDDLFFTTTNGTMYEIELNLLYLLQSGAAADLKCDLGEDGTARGSFLSVGRGLADAAQSLNVLSNQTDIFQFGGTTTQRLASIKGWHQGNGGTFRLRWAQNSATVGVYTRMLADSYLRYRTVP